MHIEPKTIIETYKEIGDIRETAHRCGICPRTVKRWLKRARSPYPYGPPRYVTRGLKRRSTRPKRVREPALSGAEKMLVAEVRRRYGSCAEKIRAETGVAASASTVQRFLKRRGYIKAGKRHRRPVWQNTTHMHLKNTEGVGFLQMDVKYLTPQLTGLPWTCFEYAVIDIYSRYKEAVILNQLDQDGAILALTEIIHRLPFRATFIQTDNGLEFQKRFRAHAEALGLKYHAIHKSSPNENAVIERSFRTDEEEFIYRHAPFSDYDDLGRKYAEWLIRYNTKRPHLGIDLKTPIEVVRSMTAGV